METILDHVLDGTFRPAGGEIIFRDFGDETVVANLETGLFYSLGGSAGEIWSGLVAGRNGSRIAEAFSSEEPEVVKSAVGRFIAALIGEKLLEPGNPPTAVDDYPSKTQFTPPTLERFDDLQALLLVDPIHDVGGIGWPSIPEPAGEFG
jgi:hypothetical protein